jgi:competence protein ComEA
MKKFWGIAFGVTCGLLGAGILLLAVTRPRGDPIKLIPPPSPAPIIVHVAGAVNEPGVHTLPNGSRVKDAVERSGGLADDADSDLINLAKPLKDGEQIWVPAEDPVKVIDVSDELTTKGDQKNQPAQRININSASQADLETLPGIGPVIAQAIIQFRLENGPFEALNEIQSVSGIGPVTFEKIQSLITIGGAAGD